MEFLEVVAVVVLSALAVRVVQDMVLLDRCVDVFGVCLPGHLRGAAFLEWRLCHLTKRLHQLLIHTWRCRNHDLLRRLQKFLIHSVRRRNCESTNQRFVEQEKLTERMWANQRQTRDLPNRLMLQH